jgi:hypothetical protein
LRPGLNGAVAGVFAGAVTAGIPFAGQHITAAALILDVQHLVRAGPAIGFDGIGRQVATQAIFAALGFGLAKTQLCVLVAFADNAWVRAGLAVVIAVTTTGQGLAATFTRAGAGV